MLVLGTSPAGTHSLSLSPPDSPSHALSCRVSSLPVATEFRVFVIYLHCTWQRGVSEDRAERLEGTQDLTVTSGPTHSSPNSKSPPG